MNQHNQEIVQKLQELDPLPDEGDSWDFPLQAFDDLVQQIQVPISEETALALLNLSPSVDSSCGGVEWSLVHAVECLEHSRLERVLEQAKDGEVKELVKIQLENGKRPKGETDEG